MIADSLSRSTQIQSRVVTASSSVEKHLQNLVHSAGGPVCHMSKPQAATVCLPSTRSASVEHRCSKHKLVRPCSLCVSTNSSTTKKAGLDKNILKNYRPVSNLSYISKLIEKAVAKQINEHIAHEGISNENQSAYRVFHSTETALLKIQNDIATSMDKGAAVGLVLLDLSAAFDTIDHSILFNCLQHWYGIDGVVLKWVQSYLNSRKQRIKIDGHLSDAFQLPYGVPQGSVLGPLLFTLYTTPLSSVISKFNVTHHLYADDTQIYLELDSRNFDSSITELANCLEAVQAWMGNNKLKLNPDKTEFIVIGDDQIRSSLKSSFPVSLLGNTMEPAESVKNLGVILDAENSMQRHVANLCRISYYHLRELRRVRRYLNHETAVKVANALVSSCLDYCNSLLYNTKKGYTESSKCLMSDGVQAK